MDLGLDFDDEDLEVKPKASKENMSTRQPYNVRVYKPEWFESALAHLNENNKQCSQHATQLEADQIPHAYKMSGDIHYYKRDYKKASEQYLTALALLPETNVCVRQDVLESLSRSYIYLGQVEESYRLAKNLVNEMSTQDEARQRQSLILFSFICNCSGQWNECVECLEKLCHLQPYYAQHWSQLGDTYAKLYESDSGHSPEDRNKDLDIEYLIKRITCYTRAKLLHQSVLSTASGVIRNRNVRILSELQHKIDCIPLTETLKDLATERMQNEIENQSSEATDSPPAISHCDVTGLPGNSTAPLNSFYHKFFSWHPEFKTDKCLKVELDKL